jgi:hypothetical protein
MATARRWLQFSLRGFLVMLTLGSVWFGWKAERAREQRQAVTAIEAFGGLVYYDWQEPELDENENVRICFVCSDKGPPGPNWLRRLIGDDFFQEVRAVCFEPRFAPRSMIKEPNTLAAIPHLAHMRGLKMVKAATFASDSASKVLEDMLEASLPLCEVSFERWSTWGLGSVRLQSAAAK